MAIQASRLISTISNIPKSLLHKDINETLSDLVYEAREVLHSEFVLIHWFKEGEEMRFDFEKAIVNGELSVLF